MHLTGLTEYSLKWVSKIKENHHGRWLSTTTDASELSIGRKSDHYMSRDIMVAIWAETQSDFSAWQCLAIFCITGVNLLGNASILSDPSYSPDIAPSNYHLFR